MAMFPVEPWVVRETRLDLDDLAQTESLFALSNGHLGLRGNLDEGEPFGLPGTYLNSFYEERPLPYAEAGYGFPEEGQSILNVTNGKVFRLLVDDEPFDVRYGNLLGHERVLDLRAGTLRRDVDWVSPAGQRIKVHTTRLVSLEQRSVAAFLYEVEPVDGPARVIVQSELVANEDTPEPSKDPRVAAVLGHALESEEHAARDLNAQLLHRTKASWLRLGAEMDHEVEAPVPVRSHTEATPDWARTTFACELQPGQRLRIVKYLAYGWSSQRSRQAIRDQVHGAIAGARLGGWDGLLAAQRRFLDGFWAQADVELDGDAEIQQAVRFALFHLMQAGARAEARPIAAKGLTGRGYDGHVFWDTESFVLPVLTYTHPLAARDGLRWRHDTLSMARDRAAQLGLAGAAFPWRTVRGQECSAYWPAGTAGFHVNADIAAAVERYVRATGDTAFEVEFGLEVLVETARLWRSLGHHDRHGVFHIDGVTGPDEYSAIADDNIYTNLMAQQNLLAAASAAERHPDAAHAFGVDDEEIASWRDAAARVHLPYNTELGVHEQSAGFTRHQEWDFPGTPADHYPLLLHYPYFDLYRKQVVKQADLVLAMHWRGDAFTAEQKARNFAYYDERTVRDSSLSACTQAVMAAEVGHTELAYDYLGEAAFVDLYNLQHNAGDGLHMASLAGTWLALVAGFGGMRDHGGELSFMPRLPDRLDRMSFAITCHGSILRVVVDHQEATYTVDSGKMTLRHHGEQFTVEPDKPVTLRVPPPRPATPAPHQPAGREPRRRHRTA
ncbi:glycoside hydrolase family 65 protein [Dactylosporangium aurantiacum]|uniref:Glycoside hydrolase family 65 protein n=1 Tax=Dactylosporangium aurantiacum TaxID=35754 RepID=A0A9Q9II11_9ACTN|nr:glycosyl hydrolase family 65 protein [Dactylosporangium aurantiacum]MDG6108120.1 glycosyl hydrolase family 65 protein [Dactylosporangium aurantiacum]UWZ53749.1 glycoside hydrolase family 65 protein [Dactylosporangium aurantiacum]